MLNRFSWIKLFAQSLFFLENSSVIAGAYTQPLITAPVPRVFPEPYLPPASAVSGYPQTSMASVSPQFTANPLSPLRPVQISLVPSQESKAVRTFPPKAVVSPLDEPSGNLSSPVMTPLRQLSLTNDDLLSMLPSSSEDVPILQPEKLTIEDIKRMKAQEEHPSLKEPLTDPSVLEKFERNFRSFEEYAEKLINQPDKLDYAWKVSHLILEFSLLFSECITIFSLIKNHEFTVESRLKIRKL